MYKTIKCGKGSKNVFAWKMFGEYISFDKPRTPCHLISVRQPSITPKGLKYTTPLFVKSYQEYIIFENVELF